jgi:plasmid stabilization system protein ParE
MAPRVREVVWAESARDALDDVITYITQDSKQAAIHVLEAALEAASSLARLAERGRVVPELNDPVLREIFVFRYRLMYRVEPDRVVVVAFLHGARDFASWRRGQDAL